MKKMDLLGHTIEWTNQNSGFLALLIFLAALFLGWISGIFSSLRRKPKLKITVLPGPNITASFPTGRYHNSHEMHRTSLAVYIKVANIGKAPTSIDEVHVGYKSQAYRNPLRWYWLKHQVVCKSDFAVNLGVDKKIFPFLMQQNQLTSNDTDTYLREGQSANGMVYFEQSESWGNFFPKFPNNTVRIKVKVYDSFGHSYHTKSSISKVTLEAARTVCEKFGQTRESLAKTE